VSQVTKHIQMAIGIRKRIISRFLLAFMVGVFGISTTVHAMLPMLLLAMGGGGMMHGMMHGASGHGEKHDTSGKAQPEVGHGHADPAAQRNGEAHSRGGGYDRSPADDNLRLERTEPRTSATTVQSGN
jgi:hypothetical protein